MSPAPGPTPPSVDDEVTVRLTSPVLNRATGTFDVHATIINTSRSTLDAPMLFVVTGTTPSGVTLANAAGTTADGFPFVTVPIASRGFTPGRAVSVLLKFSNVSLARFTVTRSVRASVRAAPTVVAVQPNPVVVALGSVKQLTLTIQNPSAQPMRVTLSSSGPTIVTVTPSVVVPAGRTTATATVAGRLVGGPVSVTATLGSSSATTNVSVAPRPPAPVVFGPLREGATLVDGSGVAGAAVSVLVDGQVAGTGAVAADGHFTVVVSPLAVGDTVRAIQSVAGVPSAPSAQFIVAPAPLPAPIIEAPLVAGTTVVHGSAVPGASVDVIIDATTAASAVATSRGQFAATVPPLTEGARVSAIQSVAGARSVESATLLVVGSPPPPLVSTPLVAGATVVAGLGVGGATVAIVLDDAVSGTATVDASGTWSLVVSPLPLGGVITVSQTIAGRSSAPSSGVTIVVPPPPPIVLGPLVAGSVAVSGRGTPSATVELFIDGGSAGTSTVGADGIWVRVISAALTTGAGVQASQTIGRLSSDLSPPLIVVSPPPAPSVTAPLVAGLTEITGIGTPRLTIDVQVNGASGGVTDVGADGTWTLALDRALAAGDAVRASQLLAGGMSVLSDTVIVVTPPPPPVIAEPLFANDTIVRGTGIPGASVRVFIDGVVTGSTAVTDDGAWSLPLGTRLVAGLRITATQTVAGVESPASAAVIARAVLRRIDVSPASITLNPGQTQAFAARGTFSDGSVQSPLSGVQWSSDAPGVATIDATTGVASAVAVGTTTIRATRDGIRATATLTVKVVPTLTWANPADVTFGTPLSSTQLNATADVPGAFAYAPPAGTVLNAGNGQTLSVTFTPTDTTSFTTATKSVTINVLRATRVITWANPADIIAGTPLSSTQLNATANVAGTFTYTPPAGTVLNPGGGQTLSVTFTPADTSNFTTATRTVTINVLSRPPTVTGLDRTSALPGDSLTITGTNLDTTTSVTFFNGVPASFTVISSTQIVATVPNGATSGPITVTTPSGSATSSSSLTVASITISPATAAMVIGGSFHFTLTVSNLADTSVTFTVNGTVGGNASVGTITSDGTYTAPAAVPSPATVTIRAMSVAAPTVFADATVTIVSEATGFGYASVSVGFGPPPSGTIQAPALSVEFTAPNDQPTGTTLQFTPTAPGPFTFSVNGIVGGNATVGTITQGGLYTAPASVPNPATVTITAQSVADPSVVITRTLTIVNALTGFTTQPVSVGFGPPLNDVFAHDVSVTNAPVIISRVPSSAAAGTTFTLTLTGANFSGATGLTFLLNGSADSSVSATGMSVSPKGDQLTTTVTIDAAATAGARVIVVNTPTAHSTGFDTRIDTLTVTGP